MSRVSISAFLSKAKHSLSQSIRSKGEHPASFVIGNESADLDSIACALVYGYIHSSTPEARKANKCMIPVTNIPSSELRLRPELTALLKQADLKPADLVTLDDLGNLSETLPPEKTDWTLVDHNTFQGALGKKFSGQVIGVIDHHEDEGNVPKNLKTKIIEKTGSCCSHVVNACHDTWDSISSSSSTADTANGHADGERDDVTQPSTWDAQVAKLALGAILIDTVNFKAEKKVTDDDRKAVEYLEAKINASPEIGPNYERDAFFMEINDAKSDLRELSLEDILGKDYKQWSEGDVTLGISSVVKAITYLKTKDEKLVPALLDFAKKRDLDIFAIMTAHNDSDAFERQLLLIAMDNGKPLEAVEKFVKSNSEELQLEESNTELDTSEATWIRLWELKNLEASRKQVAPLLREAMA